MVGRFWSHVPYCILSAFVQFQGAQEAQQDGHSSGGEIVVHDVADIEVHFGKLRLHLEDVLVSRMFRGKRNLNWRV